MIKFNFTFQRILEIKEKEKENAQLQMAQARKREEKIRSRLELVTTSLTAAEEEFTEKQLQGISINDLRHFEAYVSHLRGQLALLAKELSAAQKNVDQKQDGLVEKMKEEKIWSTLKEKKALEFIEQLNKEEQHQLDEIASRKYFNQVMRSEEVGRK